MAPNREFVPLSEVANRWNYPEDHLIDWAMQNRFYLYYYWRFQRTGRWVAIIDNLGCFLQGEDSIYCSNYIIWPLPMQIVPFAVRNEHPVDLEPNFSLGLDVEHTVPVPACHVAPISFYLPELERESKQIKKSDLFLFSGEIADMECWSPSLISKNIEQHTEDNKIATFHYLEKESLAKLIFTMAKDKYQYDPEASKSDVPKKIEQAAARANISIDSDTISKWLQKGAGLMGTGRRHKK